MAKDPFKDKKLNRMFGMAQIENDIRALERSIDIYREEKGKDKRAWSKVVDKWLARLKDDKNKLKKVM